MVLTTRKLLVTTSAHSLHYGRQCVIALAFCCDNYLSDNFVVISAERQLVYSKALEANILSQIF